jgi:phospholipase/lecithinase/hemolysin
MNSMWDFVRRASLGGVVVAAAVVSGCGGGQQVKQFIPSRIVVLGDENSLLVDLGDHNARKYSVNAVLDTDNTVIACKGLPLWIQVLGGNYGITYNECNTPNPIANPAGRIRAALNAHVADIAGQVDAQNNESPLNAGDFVTVLVGQHDILDAYAQYPSVGEDQLIANLEAIGAQLGAEVNRITDSGAKVLLSTVFNQGITPFAAAEKAANADTDRAALLQRLTERFNASMRNTILNDGRKIGLILTDEYFNTIFTTVNGGGFTNVTAAACDLTKSQFVPPSSLDCTVLTLVSGATVTTYLWADSIHLSGAAQGQLGQIAVTRASNNPF